MTPIQPLMRIYDCSAATEATVSLGPDKHLGIKSESAIAAV